MKNKTADTSVPIDPLLARRWSPRAIDGARAISRAHLTALLEAARWAPSCFGDEPWRLVVADRSSDPDAWQAVSGLLSEGNRGWAARAPVLIVMAADSEFRNGKPNRWGQYDTGAAGENLCLQATSLGLVAHQMGGFDKDALKATLAVPESFTLMAVIAIGHPGDPEELDDGRREKELAPRARRPLAEIAFEGAWAKPYSGTG